MKRIFALSIVVAGLAACPGPVVKKPPAKASTDKADGTTDSPPPDKADKAASEAPATDKPAPPPKDK